MVDFFIGAADDKQTYGSIPYLHIWNAHILEHVIASAFENFSGRLSDTLSR